MIRVEFSNYDMDENPNYPNIEMSIVKTGSNIAYITNMFRQFLLAMEFSPDLVEEYIHRVDDIDARILERSIEKINELSEKNAKVSEESADNVTSPKINLNSDTDKEVELEHKDDGSIDIKLTKPSNEKPVKDWDLEDWRFEFVRWMKERDAWGAYEKACRDNEDSEREDFEEMGDPLNFTNNAFTWNDHIEYLDRDEWDELDTEWVRHVNSLKGEN